MNKSKIKICGVQDIKTINLCIKKNINFFGLIFYKKSPRNIDMTKAIKLVEYAKNKNIHSVGVFVNESIKNLFEYLLDLNINYIQLHGNENNNYIKLIKKKFDIQVIKTVSINNKSDFNKLNQYPDADFLLFDYKPKTSELPGGNAKSFNWNLLKDINVDKKWFLSGGINIKNINDINTYSIPYGIDISSGVEDRPGIKNNKKISSLIDLYESK